MARTITPTRHLATLRVAHRVAIQKGMLAEAAEVETLITEVEKILTETR